MSKADLVLDLRRMLGSAADKFQEENDADFQRHLDVAAFELGRVRSRTLVGSVTLVADQDNYPAPTDLVQVKWPIWGTKERLRRRPWDPNWPATLPRLFLVESGGARELRLDPAPTAAQIVDLGAAYRFYYYAAHTVADAADQTTVRAADRPLLLVRAMAQALSELANQATTKPVQLGDGIGSLPKNGTSAALAKAALELFDRMAA